MSHLKETIMSCNRFLAGGKPLLPIVLSLVGFLFLIAPIASANDADEVTPEIKRAIERGVAFLKGSQKPDGQFANYPGTGATALAGLALLEADVPVSDPVIQKVIGYLHENLDKEQKTYHLSLMIMFFDSLTRKEPNDVRILRSVDLSSIKPKRLPFGRTLVSKSQIEASDIILMLGKRLLQGQGPKGSWSYFCSGPRDGDHSNTQFATLGVWVATIHGLEGKEALKRCANHFRGCQGDTGGWDYINSTTNPYCAMTSAGLLALATDLGVTRLTNARVNDNAIAKDRHRRKGIEWLTQWFAEAKDANLYTLWSLERVGIFYGIRSFGKVAWYPFGAELLLKSQKENGAWFDTYGETVDTSFALLFLCRANIAPELTQSLTGAASEKDGPQAMRAIASGVELEAALQDDQRTLLLKELTQAKPERQRQIIDQLTAGKGNDYTNALVQAHLLLDDDTIKAYAAEAMNQRMVRMTAKTLAYKLTESEQLIRLAAIRAVATKQERSLLPNLIELLVHGDTATWQAARDTLRQLSGEDFGPEAESVLQRVQAKRLWSEWWEKQPKP